MTCVSCLAVCVDLNPYAFMSVCLKVETSFLALNGTPRDVVANSVRDLCGEMDSK